ncbi:hypothetical protein HPG69_017424, partial [Diceros bicornis minor]
TSTVVAEKDHPTAHSEIVEVTAGVCQQERESLILSSEASDASMRVNNFEFVITQIVKDAPERTVVVFNPVDILTYGSWKPKEFPKHHVIGRGCKLDSDRFCCLMSEKFSLPEAVILNGFWKNMATQESLQKRNSEVEIVSDRVTEFERSVNQMIGRSSEAITLKVHSNWGVGFNVAELIQMLLEKH